jgi:vacuolar-type H+-ATPase subunit D/Vma8
MKTEQLRQLTKIIDVYGSDHQQDKAIEECSELIQAICKYKECLDYLENIIDEIADVEIMLNQLKIIFPVPLIGFPVSLSIFLPLLSFGSLSL